MSKRSHLQCRRIAAHCLNRLTEELKLGAKAIRFDAEDPSLWEVPTDWQMYYLRGGHKIVAEVYLVGDKADIVIPSWYDIIRNEHLDSFQPHEHGLIIDNGYNPFTMDPNPDGLVFGLDYGEIPLINAPPRPIPRSTRSRPIRAIVTR